MNIDNKKNNIYFWAGISFVLLVQNLIYLFPHWFMGASFPGDFVKSYHAIPCYLIKAYQSGVGLDWIPFSGMGYPTLLNLQSGMYYPPFWLFALLGIEYSIDHAIVLQCLTIWFGALGCSFLARNIGMTWCGTLLAGFLFQGFGGFVLNSMHPDIIRGFALAPWVAAPVITQFDKQLSQLSKIALITLPFSVYALWVAAYPGITIAVLFTFTLVAFSRFIKRDFKYSLLILLGIVIGTILAAPALGPAIFMKSHIGRSKLSGISYDFAQFKDVFALIYDTDSRFFGHDPSMNSLYIGIPALVLIFIGVNLNKVIFYRFLLVFLIAIIMATGLLSPIWEKIAAPLLYSRFQYSDYKILVIIPLIIFAASNFGKIKQNMSMPIIFLLFIVAMGNAILPSFGAQVYMPKSTLPPEWRFIGIVVSCAFVSLFFLFNKYISRYLAVVLLIGIISLDWARIHWNHYHHALNNGVNIFNSGHQFEQTGVSFENQTRKLQTILRFPLTQRPSRIDLGETGYCWRGYYSGEFHMRDWSGPMQFTKWQNILRDNELYDFAKQPWMALWIERSRLDNWKNLAKCETDPIYYGTDKLVYKLKAAKPGIFVTNEMYFPGWTATLNNVVDNSKNNIEATDIDGFRAYSIPSGEFEILERFELPYKNVYSALAYFGLLLFSLYCFFIVRQKPSAFP
jgi:hypothetical protein